MEKTSFSVKVNNLNLNNRAFAVAAVEVLHWSFLGHRNFYFISKRFFASFHQFFSVFSDFSTKIIGFLSQKMSSKTRDRLVVTEDSEDDNEHEEMSSGTKIFAKPLQTQFFSENGSENEGPSSGYGEEAETVAFPAIQRVKIEFFKIFDRIRKKSISEKEKSG